MAASLVPVGPGRLAPVMGGRLVPVARGNQDLPPALVVRLVSVACHASLQSWRCMGHKYTQWTREAATPTQMHSLCSLIEVKVARGNHDQMAYNKGCAC